jgi:inorganic pyrophosphatase|tara:strand:+ start:824 stop:1513 length:690 start_codon:yes stop_codon:yes gene_type:complete
MNYRDDLPLSFDKGKTVNAVIEIPKGVNTKYEYSPEYECFILSRCLVSSLHYPINYGFIPQTIAEDGDALDILVYNHDPIDMGTVVECRPVGILKFLDKGVRDDKILAVPNYSPEDKYSCLNDIEESHLKIYKHFFRIYKEDIKGEVEVGEWQNGTKAANKILSAYDRWVHQSASRGKTAVQKVRGRKWRCSNENCGKVTETPFRWVEGATTTFMCDSCRGKVEEVNDF